MIKTDLSTVAFAAFLLVTSAVSAFAGPTPRVAPHFPPIITDARSAIRIARAMELAQRPDDPMIKSEADWEAHCTAKLVNGVWSVTDKGPHAPRTGYFTGAAAIFIGAQDGRYLGAFFVD
jgi:hypothetical protein